MAGPLSLAIVGTPAAVQGVKGIAIAAEVLTHRDHNPLSIVAQCLVDGDIHVA